MRTLCFGGSFNPVHLAHLLCARAVAERAGFDRILLIPNRQPPHKTPGPELAAGEHRLAMCRLAAAEQPELFGVDDLELQRSGPSYTLETVLALKAGGMAQVHWLVGADMLLDLPRWYESARLLKETNFVVMARPGWVLDFSTLPPEYRGLEQNIVPAPLIDIRATEIRQRIRKGQSIQWLVPDPVRRYIAEHRLYLK